MNLFKFVIIFPIYLAVLLIVFILFIPFLLLSLVFWSGEELDNMKLFRNKLDEAFKMLMN